MDGSSLALADDGPQRRLWQALPTRAFVRLDGTRAFARSHVLVVLKTRDLIDDTRVVEHATGTFEFCRLGIVTSGGVPCGYALRAARCLTRVRENHCTLSLRGEPAAQAAVLFTDGTLGVVGDASGVVACISHRLWL